MKKSNPILLIVSSFATGFVVAYALGVFNAVRITDLAESSVRASLLTYELRSLRKGNLESYITQKELELDQEIFKHARFVENNDAWLLWPLSEQYDHGRYMKKVLAYRKQYPTPQYNTDLFKGTESHEIMEEFPEEVKESLRIIKEAYK